MPLVAVLSDTHSSTDYIGRVVARLQEIKPDLTLHLGDFYDDTQAIISAGFKVIQVPGTWTSYYKRTDIENRIYMDLFGWTAFLTHTPTRHFNDLPLDIDPRQVIKDRNADILMHGHTHHPKIEIENKVVIFNPGHLYNQDNRGFPPTFGLLSFSEEGVMITIQELLSGARFASKLVTKEELK